MTAPLEISKVRWLPTGAAVFAAVLEALGAGTSSVNLESYIFADDVTGRQTREALAAAALRGCKVQVLIDGVGSQALPDRFWEPLRAVGGEVRYFNRLPLQRLPIRDHRKLIIVDDAVAFIGGFNFADEYAGDGVTRGWQDLGVEVRGAAVPALKATFDEMFRRCQAPERVWKRFQRRNSPGRVQKVAAEEIMPTGPGSGQSLFQLSLNADLHHGNQVQFASAYFLPGVRLRRRLRHVIRRRGRVQIVVPGISDVPIAQNAARFLYSGLLRAGIEIYEYQPQMLHTKLYRIDKAVYVGSSNLDTRSLYINYEIMMRLAGPGITADAVRYFENLLANSRQVNLEEWRQSRSLWAKLREQWSYFLLARLDPYVSRWLGPRAR